jgi:hypothetical protein
MSGNADALRLEQMKRYVASALEMGTATQHTYLLAECIKIAERALAQSWSVK